MIDAYLCRLFQTNPDFDQLRLFVFSHALLVDPLQPIGNSADPLSCNSKTLLSQLFDFVKRKYSFARLAVDRKRAIP